MADVTRPRATRMTVCDLCDKEIPDGEPSERGSLTHGWLAYPVETGDRPTGWRRTTHAWLHWPPSERVRRTRLEKRMADPEQFRQRTYDFHAECILRLVEEAIEQRKSPEETCVIPPAKTETGDNRR